MQLVQDAEGCWSLDLGVAMEVDRKQVDFASVQKGLNDWLKEGNGLDSEWPGHRRSSFVARIGLGEAKLWLLAELEISVSHQCRNIKQVVGKKCLGLTRGPGRRTPQKPQKQSQNSGRKNRNCVTGTKKECFKESERLISQMVLRAQGKEDSWLWTTLALMWQDPG